MKCVEAIEDREMALANFEGNREPFPDNAIGRNAMACITQCKSELDFLYDCKSRIESLIGFVPSQNDYENNAQEEWKLELMHRAENFLLSGGPIPPQEIAVMRLHPEWSQINAHVKATKQALLEGNDLPQLASPIKEVLCLTNMQS